MPINIKSHNHPHPEPALLDCRPVEAFNQAHHLGSYNIPAQSLYKRMHELPPKLTSLMVIGRETDLDEAMSFLLDRDYHLTKKLIWNHEIENTLRQYGLLEEHTANDNNPSSLSRTRLWQPSPLIKYWTEHVEKVKPGKGIDIACGAGRDATWLAMHGWEMTGIDHHEDALMRCRSLADNNAVVVNTLQFDLEGTRSLLDAFEPESLDLICVARYLHRPLFAVFKELLKPGGYLLYQTFMQGCQHLGGPKNPQYLLEQGELGRAFSLDNRFEVLLDEIQFSEDYRPVSGFIACKVY